MNREIVNHRLRLWNDQLKRACKDVIRIRIGDQELRGIRNNTRPMDISRGTKGFVAKIGTELWDMGRPLLRDCDLLIIPQDQIDLENYGSLLGNSGAVLLSSAIEQMFPNAVSASKSEGLNPFFVDLQFDGSDSIKHMNQMQLDELTCIARTLAKNCIPFERMDVDRSIAQEMFQHSPFKREILSNMRGLIPLVKCGAFIDICKGLVVAHSGHVSAIKCLESSSSVLEKASRSVKLNRIHSVAFPANDLLDKWLINRETLIKSDHRHIGKNQKLFYMHHLSPGSVFMLPHGVRIVNRLLEFLRTQYRAFGYEEVISPILFHKSLWECSGHWENYKEDMFLVNQIDSSSNSEITENLEMGLKPMNCPGHCLIYSSESRSYRDLPIRFADFSPLHRYHHRISH